jgi:cellobiose phosphorylase
MAEPYVTPGNIDGPLSEYYGRGGWTWYTGSSQWLHRVATHWILGVRPQKDGLLVDPSIPSTWPGYKVTRKFRNALYQIEVKNPENVSKGVKQMIVDGITVEGSLIPNYNDGQAHKVEIIMGHV